MYPVRKFNVTEAAYSTNLRLKMQETEGMVRCIAPSRERSLALTKLDEALFWANAARETVRDKISRQMCFAGRFISVVISCVYAD